MVKTDAVRGVDAVADLAAGPQQPSIGRFLGPELLGVTVALLVEVIRQPGGFGLALAGYPGSFTYGASHWYAPSCRWSETAPALAGGAASHTCRGARSGSSLIAALLQHTGVKVLVLRK